MFKNTKKSINWLVEEFTSIDMVAAIQPSNIRGSETQTVLMAGKEKRAEYVSTRTQNDELGRPINTKNYNEDGKVEEEYKYRYEGNTQFIELYEGGKKTCQWINNYDDNQNLLRSEYSEMTDNSSDIESFEYDAEGRLVRILVDVYPQEVEDEEPATGFEVEWEGNRVSCIREIYGEEEEARMEFEYDTDGKVLAVKKIIYLIDEDDNDTEEVMDEQKPVYNAEGLLIENTIIYHASNSKLHIQYEYAPGTDRILRTIHSEYENGKLQRSMEFFEDEQGNLTKATEQLVQDGVTKIETYSYTYA